MLRSQTAKERVSISSNLIEMARKRGQVTVKCTIDGIECQAMLDSGAGVTGISQQFYKRSRIKIKPTTTKAYSCRSVTGEVIEANQTLRGVTMEAGPFKTRLNLLVLPIEGSYEVLLGNDFMTRHHMELKFAPNESHPITMTQGSDDDDTDDTEISTSNHRRDRAEPMRATSKPKPTRISTRNRLPLYYGDRPRDNRNAIDVVPTKD